MAVQQVAGFVQNDGNFCQLDLKDVNFNTPLMRIETFRCSQPEGQFGVTGAGTKAQHLAGIDHLTPKSNQMFRHVFSVAEQNACPPKVTLEIRENFEEDGSWEARVRDLDPESNSFGSVLFATIKPDKNGMYHLHYELRKIDVPGVLVTSPLTDSITRLVPGLPDLGAPLNELGVLDTSLSGNPMNCRLSWRASKDDVDRAFDSFSSNFSTPRFSKWNENVKVYERMGDFRDKCIHPGVNLIGSNPQLASEYIPIRAYRTSLIILGRVFDRDMALGGMNFLEVENPLDFDPKPGVYSVFLQAYMLNIGIVKLGLDKVHSDYGGVPMKLAPGSRLETGIAPIADSTLANQTLAELATMFYVALPASQQPRRGIA